MFFFFAVYCNRVTLSFYCTTHETNVATHYIICTCTSVFILKSKSSYGFILRPVIIMTCDQWWISILMSELRRGSLITTAVLPISSLIPRRLNGLRSRTSSILLNSHRVMSSSVFHGLSEGISLHKSNMKGYSRDFLSLGICSCKNLQSKVFPLLIWQPYLSCLVKPIHLALSCHKYSSGTVYL